MEEIKLLEQEKNNVINEIKKILERLSNNGGDIDWEFFEKECKKTEVCASIA